MNDIDKAYPNVEKEKNESDQVLIVNKLYTVAQPHTLVYDAAQIPQMALRDLLYGFKSFSVWWNFALCDIRVRFRRSSIGPLWITVSLLVWILALGIVTTTVFNQDANKVIPFISVGIIFWTSLASAMTEGCNIFIANEYSIKALPMSLSIYLFKMIASNLIILGFNMLIYLGILFWVFDKISWHILLFIPGILIFTLNISWVSLFLGIVSARFRDIPQIVVASTQVLFFFTPVFWMPEVSIKPTFVTFNPIYHLIEIVRSPLIGRDLEPLSWIFSIGLSFFGIFFTILLYRRFYGRIPYWV